MSNSSDVIVINSQDAEVLAEPMRIAELRKRAAIDQEAQLSRFSVWPGPLYIQDGRLTAEMSPAARLFLNAGEWGIAPKAAPSHGLWHENSLARISGHAEQQLCSQLGVPRQFVKKLPVGLQTACVNHAVTNWGRDTSLLRLSTLSPDCARPDFRLRGVMSTRYTPMDDAWLFDLLSAALRRFPEAELHECRLDDTFTRLTLVFQGVDLGDSLGKVGIVVTNSEVGSAAVRIDSWVYKLVCLNGLVSKVGDGGYRFFHTGGGEASAGRREQIIGAIADSVDHGRQVANELRLGTGRPVLDPAAEFRRIAVQNNFSQAALDEIVKQYEQQPVPTVTGITDAMTARAREIEDPHQKHQLEVIAGNYLHKQVAAA